MSYIVLKGKDSATGENVDLFVHRGPDGFGRLGIYQVFDYRDFTTLAFTEESQVYWPGTAFHAANPDLPEKFTALSSTFYVTKDALVRFLTEDDQWEGWMAIPEGMAITFDSRIKKLEVKRAVEDGLLYCWFEG